MTASIEPPRRAGPVRRSRKAAAERPDENASSGAANLPVPVGHAETIAPAEPVDPTAAISAQIMGQTGARRGLRAGVTVIDTANAAYNKAEWSGAKDRRTPKGRVAKTDV